MTLITLKKGNANCCKGKNIMEGNLNEKSVDNNL